MSDLLNKASLVMIPSGYKEDVVYSAVPSDGSGDLAFSRASNGTRVNSAGLVEVCPWNLLQYSEDFTNAVWQNFNTTITSNDRISPNGTTTADKFVGTTNSTNPSTSNGSKVYFNSGAINTITPAQNNIVTGSIYLYATSAITIQLFLYEWGGAEGGQSFTLTANTWQRFEFSKTFTGGAGNIGLAIQCNAQTLWAWGAQLNIGSTAKPYFPTTDRLNVPRLTYQNGGGGCPSLLLEKQSTNLLSWSEDLTQSDWTKQSGVSVTANQTISPDGTQNADKVVGDGTLGIFQSTKTVSTTVANTKSVWLKGVSGGEVVRLQDPNQTLGYTVCTLTTSWQRFTLSEVQSGGVAGLWVTLIPSGGIYMWGAQLEDSSYATSYIGPTTSASATRVADGPLNLSTTQTLTNFTLFYDGLIFQNGENMLFGSGNSAWYIDVDGSNGRVVLDLTSGRIYTGFNAGITTNQRFKLAIKRSAGVVDAFVNGIKLTPTTQVTDTTSLTLSSITWGFSSTQYPKMKVNEICAFQSALSDSDCQALTTL